MAKLKATATLTFSQPNFVKFSKTLKTRLDAEHRNSIRVWLRALLTKIPTYTGTVRGSYKPLGRLLRVAVPIGPISKAASMKKFFKYKGKSYPLGVAEGSRYSDFNFEENTTSDGILYKFTFNNTLLYALWNELYPAPEWMTLPSNPPWDALIKGDSARKNYMDTKVQKRLPKFSELEIKTLRVR